jgi:hypothetical protein
MLKKLFSRTFRSFAETAKGRKEKEKMMMTRI